MLGRNFSFKILEARIKKLWNLENECEIVDLEKGYLVARFYSREAYLRVLEGGPWTVLGHYLTVTKWRPNFVPTEQAVTHTLIWVRFTGVPVEIFREAALLCLGNTLGCAVRVDLTSDNVERGKFARVCIDLDLTKPLVPTILALGRVVCVEYEGLPNICYKCGIYGHRLEECSSMHANVPDGAEPQPPHSKDPPGLIADTPYGTWLLQAHVRRQQKLQRNRMSRWTDPSEADRRLNLQIETELRQQRQRSGSDRTVAPDLLGRTPQVPRPPQWKSRPIGTKYNSRLSAAAILLLVLWWSCPRKLTCWPS